MIGHRLMGMALLHTGDLSKGRAHYDQALALYDPAEHRPLALRFGQDVAVATLSFRAMALWTLGYPQAALNDVENALKYAREIGQAATLMYALSVISVTYIHCGNYPGLSAQLDELVALANEKDAPLWRAVGILMQGCILALTGKAQDALPMLISGISAWRSTGSTFWFPLSSPFLARAHADVGQFDDAWRSIGEATTAIQTTKEAWYAAELNRIAGEIALKSPEPDASKAEKYFESALAIARAQQAKSWELRAAMSMARLWRDQGKRDKARELLAPVYGWFTEGFDTLDLKEAKALLDELAA
jgi:predicted ATPase